MAPVPSGLNGEIVPPSGRKSKFTDFIHTLVKLRTTLEFANKKKCILIL